MAMPDGLKGFLFLQARHREFEERWGRRAHERESSSVKGSLRAELGACPAMPAAEERPSIPTL